MKNKQILLLTIVFTIVTLSMESSHLELVCMIGTDVLLFADDGRPTEVRGQPKIKIEWPWSKTPKDGDKDAPWYKKLWDKLKEERDKLREKWEESLTKEKLDKLLDSFDKIFGKDGKLLRDFKMA